MTDHTPPAADLRANILKLAQAIAILGDKDARYRQADNVADAVIELVTTSLEASRIAEKPGSSNDEENAYDYGHNAGAAAQLAASLQAVRGGESGR